LSHSTNPRAKEEACRRRRILHDRIAHENVAAPARAPRLRDRGRTVAERLVLQAAHVAASPLGGGLGGDRQHRDLALRPGFWTVGREQRPALTMSGGASANSAAVRLGRGAAARPRGRSRRAPSRSASSLVGNIPHPGRAFPPLQDVAARATFAFESERAEGCRMAVPYVAPAWRQALSAGQPKQQRRL